MKLLIIGNKNRKAELKKRLSDGHEIVENIEQLQDADIIFDLNFDDDSSGLKLYAALENKVVIVGAVKKQLAAVVSHFGKPIQCSIIGMNTLPTFIDRDIMELSKMDISYNQQLATLNQLNWKTHFVNDRVGLVMPRIVGMIINEACFTLQEGTASIEDIDLAMKLGTNYPQGPFEWADKIGIKDVYETLLAIYEDTHDERYKVCPLLKTKYLKQESFYL